MELKIKKLYEDAKMPERANPTDAGLDLFAHSANQTGNTLDPDYVEYSTGISTEIPEGYVGLLFSRSSVTKMNMMLKNCVGVIDSGYRGEIKMRFQTTKHLNPSKLLPDQEGIYKVGDKIGQLVLVPIITPMIKEVTELNDSARGESGFGSTGN